MRIPWLWAAYDREYPDEGSALVFCSSSAEARRRGAEGLGLPLQHCSVAGMTISTLLRRLLGRSRSWRPS